MPYIIAAPCINVKDGACIDVCPVGCIHGRDGDEQLYIDPEDCIECGACAPVCPVKAIFPDDGVPEKWKSFIGKNASFFRQWATSPPVGGRPGGS
ncbi:MAG: ferredoxin family protein [Chloroflexi bacterium]|nr:ferredoxin family protein [Chloroflexota bacterium]